MRIFLTSAFTWLAASTCFAQSCDELEKYAATGSQIPISLIEDSAFDIGCVLALISERADVSNSESLSFDDLDVKSYLSLTSAAIRYAESESGHVNQIRALDSLLLAQTLSSGSRSPIKEVRINSARLFSNIIDESTLCVALDYLHAPVILSEIDHPTILGRGNLLAIVRNASKSVGPMSRKAIESANNNTIAQIEKDKENPIQRDNLSVTERITSEITQNLSHNNSTRNDIEEFNECLSYNFEYWTDNNTYKE